MPKRAGEGFLPTAEAVLKRAGKPLRVREIVERAVAAGNLESAGSTPENTLSALLQRNISRLGAASKFKKVGPGLYQLRGRD
ncbi:winged helix-turn-helix domain-containing protein [Stenotrophomonas maltophilia]|uniref:winged helix-turn-helix domain-containing protein n=1 Tax=Stenotrophomonas TaxID=40323 RepID=UPI000D7D7A0C|nr:hypothetical protein DM611_04540 [Stenotrophomonas maltophilia]MBA0360312.1 hypothetical protein [Stenotrophomonas maltophilia]